MRLFGLGFLFVAATSPIVAGESNANFRQHVNGFGLNDVSVLIPLPSTQSTLDLLISVKDLGHKGEILARGSYIAPKTSYLWLHLENSRKTRESSGPSATRVCS